MASDTTTVKFFKALSGATDSAYRVLHGSSVPSIYRNKLLLDLATTFSYNSASILTSTINTAISTIIAAYPTTSTTSIGSYPNVDSIESVSSPYITTQTVFPSCECGGFKDENLEYGKGFSDTRLATLSQNALLTGRLIYVGGDSFSSENGGIHTILGDHIVDHTSTSTIELPNVTGTYFGTYDLSAKSSVIEKAETVFSRTVDTLAMTKTCTANYTASSINYRQIRKLTPLQQYPYVAVTEMTKYASADPSTTETMYVTVEIPSSYNAISSGSISYTMNSSTSLNYPAFKLECEHTVSKTRVGVVMCVIPHVTGVVVTDVTRNGNTVLCKLTLPYSADTSLSGFTYSTKCTVLSSIVPSTTIKEPMMEAYNMIKTILNTCKAPYSKWTMGALPEGAIYINGYGPLLVTKPVSLSYTTVAYNPVDDTLLVDSDYDYKSVYTRHQQIFYMDKTVTNYFGNFTPDNSPTFTTSTITATTHVTLRTALTDNILATNFVNRCRSQVTGVQCLLNIKTSPTTAELNTLKNINTIMANANSTIISRAIRPRTRVIKPMTFTESKNPDSQHRQTTLNSELLWTVPLMILNDPREARKYIEAKFNDAMEKVHTMAYYGNGITFIDYNGGINDSSILATSPPVQNLLLEIALIGFHAWNCYRMNKVDDGQWLSVIGYDIIKKCATICVDAFDQMFSSVAMQYYYTLRNVVGINDTSGKTANFLTTMMCLNCIYSAQMAAYDLRTTPDSIFTSFLGHMIQLPVAKISSNLYLFQDIESLQSTITAGLSTTNIPTTAYSEVLIGLHPIYIRYFTKIPLSVFNVDSITPFTLNTGNNNDIVPSTFFTNNANLYATKFTSTTDPTSLICAATCIAYGAQMIGVLGQTMTDTITASLGHLYKAINTLSYGGNITLSTKPSIKNNVDTLPLECAVVLTFLCGFLSYTFRGAMSNTFATTEQYGWSNGGVGGAYLPSYIVSIYHLTSNGGAVNIINV